MFFRTPPLRFVAAAGAWLVAVLGAKAELASTSPFLPPGGQPVAAPTNSVPLELRGIAITDGQTEFLIYDPSKKRGTRVRLNEPGHEFSVKKFDPDNENVTIEHRGQTHIIQMRAPKIASAGNAVAPPAASGPAVVAPPNPVTRNVVANPTPATEAARLADWQAEIQRRRDMRAQATAAAPATAVPAQVAPPVQPQNLPPPQQQPNQQRQRPSGQRQRNGQ
jgi:hypothetical protein